MKCDGGGRREAAAMITMIVNGKNSVRRVCRECVRKLQRGDAYAAQMAILSTVDAPEREAYCPVCGASWEQVRKSGRMGCATCYQAFDTLVQPLMVRMNGIPQQHAADETGHAPEAPANEKQARINKLREEMFAAVNAEEYERAAQLRDQIRLLEREGGAAEE